MTFMNILDQTPAITDQTPLLVHNPPSPAFPLDPLVFAEIGGIAML
jgi:hypothetical protein